MISRTHPTRRRIHSHLRLQPSTPQALVLPLTFSTQSNQANTVAFLRCKLCPKNDKQFRCVAPFFFGCPLHYQRRYYTVFRLTSSDLHATCIHATPTEISFYSYLRDIGWNIIGGACLPLYLVLYSFPVYVFGSPYYLHLCHPYWSFFLFLSTGHWLKYYCGACLL